MKKSNYEEALELLNNGCDGPDAFEIYKIALEKAQKQEKLLGLYRQLVKDLGLIIEYDTTDTWDGPVDCEYLEIDYDSIKALNTYKQIKELENDNT